MSIQGRSRIGRSFDIWPGYVDVLSTLLMVIIFVLMVFVIAQFFLSDALTGRDQALDRLNREISELSELLALERAASADMRTNMAELSAELQNSIRARDELDRQLTVVIGERDALAASLADANARQGEVAAARDEMSQRLQVILDERDALDASLAEAYETIDADREKIEALVSDVAALESLRDELEAKLLATEEDAQQEVAEMQERLSAEQEISEESRRQIAILNQQLVSLRERLGSLAAALEASEEKVKEQEIQIADLGSRLNMALANKVEELARYRSEFFGRLREVLGDRDDVQIVGDRFVFQSEVLFDTASADLEPAGRERLAQFADTLLEIAAKIPDDIHWMLRVDGHTDQRPISTAEFPSNLELSTARAISVVNFLESRGVPSGRMVPAGFGAHYPLDPSDTVEAYRKNRRIELKLDRR